MAVVPASTVTIAQMAAHLNGAAADADVIRWYAEAKLLTADVFAQAWRDVPVEVVDDVVYRVGRALKDSGKKAATGAGQVAVTDGSPSRVPADPYASSYALIRRYVVLGL